MVRELILKLLTSHQYLQRELRQDQMSEMNVIFVTGVGRGVVQAHSLCALFQAPVLAAV